MSVTSLDRPAEFAPRLGRHRRVGNQLRDLLWQFATRIWGPSRDPSVFTPFDGSKLLRIYLILLVLVPSNLAVKSIGAAGTPSSMFGLYLLTRWAVARSTKSTPHGRTALRLSFAFFALVIIAAYVVAHLRPLDSLEVNGADRGLIRLASWSGVFLVALDGLPTRRAFLRVTETAALSGTIVAALGLFQRFSGYNVPDHIRVPGLTPLSAEKIGTPELRNNLPRIYATTSHPIEFATVLVLFIAITAPLALREQRDRRARWWLVALSIMSLAFPLAVARSGFLAFAVLAAVVIPRLTPRLRRWVLIMIPVGLGFVHMLYPGLLGAIRSMFLFTAAGDETARTSDYPVVWQQFLHRPWFGQGFGTYLSELYRVLDNQFLLSVVETGLFGLIAYAVLHLAAMRTAARARRRATSNDDRMVGAFLIGAPVAALVSALTFDAFSFPMFAGVFFVVIGLCGAYARLMERESAPVPLTQLPQLDGSARTRQRATVAACAFAVLVVGLGTVRSTPPSFMAFGSALVVPADLPPADQFTGSLGTGNIADLVRVVVSSSDAQADLYDAGHTAPYTVALGGGSLEYGTDTPGYQPLIEVRSISHDPVQAEGTVQAVMSEVRLQLRRLQSDVGVAARQQAVLVDTGTTSQAAFEHTGGKRAYIGVLLLAIGFALLADRTYTATRILRRRRRARRPATATGLAPPVAAAVTPAFATGED